MCDLGRVALPELEEERRPKRHEDGKDDRHAVVKEVHDLRVQACLVQGPVVAEKVAGGADFLEAIV